MENKIEAVVRENVDTALEQADEFLKQAEKLPVKLTTASAPILGALSVSQLSAASCSVSWLLASNSSRGFRR